MKKLVLIFTAIWFVHFNIYAQMKLSKGIIFGIVTDQTEKPLSYCTVSLLDGKDSLISGTLTDTTGMFIFKDIDFGTYKVEIKFIGFEKKVIDSLELSKEQPVKQLGKIAITPSDNVLDKVVITGQQSAVKFEVDKKVVYPSRDLSAKGGSVADALRSAPSVQVDVQGNVSLRGSSNYIVLINGKPTIQDPKEALKQMPASAVDRIEIITNPSAKYDPDGTAGIINIITKKNAGLGLSGKIELSGNTYGSKGATIYALYRTRKSETLFQFDYLNQVQKISLLTYSKFKTDTSLVSFYENSLGHNIYDNISAKIGYNRYLSDNSNFLVNVEAGQRNMIFSTNTQEADTVNNIRTFLLSENIMSNPQKFGQIDLNFEHKFKKAKLNSYVLLSKNLGDATSTFNTDTTNSSFDPSGQTYNEKITQSRDETKFRFQTDYEQNLFGGKYETGIAFRYLDLKGQNNMFVNFGNAENWQEIEDQDVSFDMQRKILAFYNTYSNKIGFLNYKIGLRLEGVQREINIGGQIYTVERLDYFPTVHFSSTTKNGWNYQMSYSRRINRPSFFQLNPVKLFISSKKVVIGNPDLLPEYVNSYEFTITKKIKMNTFTAELFHTVGKNSFTQSQFPYDERHLQFSWLNADMTNSSGAELSANFVLMKMFMVYSSFQVMHYSILGVYNSQSISKSALIANGKAFLMTMLPTGTSVQIGGFWQGRNISLTGELSPAFISMLGLQQSLFKKKLNISASLMGLFNDIGMDIITQVPDNYTITKFYMGRYLQFSVSYKIGKFKENKKLLKKDEEAKPQMLFGG